MQDATPKKVRAGDYLDWLERDVYETKLPPELIKNHNFPTGNDEIQLTSLFFDFKYKSFFQEARKFAVKKSVEEFANLLVDYSTDASSNKLVKQSWLLIILRAFIEREPSIQKMILAARKKHHIPLKGIPVSTYFDSSKTDEVRTYVAFEKFIGERIRRAIQTVKDDIQKLDENYSFFSDAKNLIAKLDVQESIIEASREICSVLEIPKTWVPLIYRYVLFDRWYVELAPSDKESYVPLHKKFKKHLGKKGVAKMLKNKGFTYQEIARLLNQKINSVIQGVIRGAGEIDLFS